MKYFDSGFLCRETDVSEYRLCMGAFHAIV